MKPYIFFVSVSLTLLCESTVNWQPVKTSRHPHSAPTYELASFSQYKRSTFLNWPFGNLIYSRSVAAEFAAFSICFGKIGVKTWDKITKAGILSRETDGAFEQSREAPNVNSRIEWRLRWAGVSGALALRLQGKRGHTPWGVVKAGHARPTSRDTCKHTFIGLCSEKKAQNLTFLRGEKRKQVFFPATCISKNPPRITGDVEYQLTQS